MLLSQILRDVRPFNNLTNQNTNYVMPYLNEIKSENIKQIVGISNNAGLTGYVVFYEDENIYACPKCDHHISNTFSFCPNCGYKMSSEADEARKCPGCSHDISSTFTFCPDCGTKLQ